MTAREIQHLYWRAGFGISPNALKALKSSTRHSIVSDLFKKSIKTKDFQALGPSTSEPSSKTTSHGTGFVESHALFGPFMEMM